MNVRANPSDIFPNLNLINEDDNPLPLDEVCSIEEDLPPLQESPPSVNSPEISKISLDIESLHDVLGNLIINFNNYKSKNAEALSAREADL